MREQERDTSKFWKKNSIRIAYVGIENETEPEDDMPFRVIGYDGAAYRDQICYEVDENGRRKKMLHRYPLTANTRNDFWLNFIRSEKYQQSKS